MDLKQVEYFLRVAERRSFSRAPSVAIAGLALVCAHGATSTIWIASAQLLQVTVPNHVLGRVLAVELLLVTAAIAGSGTLVAWLLGPLALHPRDAASVLAALLLVPFVLWALAWRRHATALDEARSRST